MGSLLSALKSKNPNTTSEKSAKPAAMGSAGPKTFQHYGDAQTKFVKTLPLIANDNAYLADVFSSEHLSPEKPISAGFYRLDIGQPLVYTYTYDEMKIIVDGDFEISDESGQSVKAGKGDVFFFPKGSVITFKTVNGGLGFFCGQRGKDSA